MKVKKKSIYSYMGAIMLVMFVLVICGCGGLDELFFGTLYGPYHHDAIAITPTNVITVKDQQYCTLYNSVCALRDGEFQLVSSRHGNDSEYLGWAQDVQTDGEKLYVSSYYSLIQGNGIAAFSSDFQYEGAVLSGQIRSFLLQDNLIYYVERIQADEREEYYFCRYNRILEQTEVISEEIPLNEIIEVDGRKIYANMQRMLYWADGAENINYAKGYPLLWNTEVAIQEFQSLGFYYDDEVGTVTTNNNVITVAYGDKTVSFAPNGKFILYPRIFVEKEKLHFAAYEFIENENCTSAWCICHFGKSRIFEYDFIMEELTDKHETNEKEYIISFDAANLVYYSKGMIIKNQQLIKDVHVIEPLGEFMQRGTSPKGLETRISLSVFYDSGDTVVYTYSDNSNYIKDEYF